MLSLPLITPRDSHELWFGSSQSSRSSSQINQPIGDPNQAHPRRNANNTLNGRSSATSGNSLSSLLLEERALRARKQNIASFGYSWIKPAGCLKTMLGMKEEEAEREEALAAAAAEMAAAAAAADPTMEDDFDGRQQGGNDGQDDTGMERDLDDDIPDADASGLIEEGEEGLEEEDAVDEEGYMERDLDDDIPEGLPDDEDDYEEEEEEEDDFDNQPDLDDDIPAAGDEGDMSEGMIHDLDDDIPEAVEDASGQEEEWQHTDTDADFDDDDDDDDDDDENEENQSHDPFAPSLRASTSSHRGLPPPPAPMRRERETPAQRRFLQRWSGGGDTFDSSSMMLDEEDLRSSFASHVSRRSGFGRFPRRRGGPRDSFD